jgi:hypothetical protein
VANRERRVAQARFVQLRQRSNRVFELDKAIKDLPGSTQARQNLVSASLEYLEGLAPAARGDLDLAREIGLIFSRSARLPELQRTRAQSFGRLLIHPLDPLFRQPQ